MMFLSNSAISYYSLVIPELLVLVRVTIVTGIEDSDVLCGEFVYRAIYTSIIIFCDQLNRSIAVYWN